MENNTNKIKQTLTITIVDENGSKQFTMAKIIQKIIIYGGIFLILAIIGGYFAMSSFVQNLETITTAQQDAYSEFQSVYEQNTFLQDDIQNKTEELQTMYDKIQNLEKMVNISSFNNEEAQKDINFQDLASTQKETMLQIIPNGNPVDLFEMKQKTKIQSKESYILVNAGYTPAKNAVNMGYDYYTGRSEPVYATADGIVESTRDGNQHYGYGNLVRLSHVLGFSTAYTNLEKVNVQKGDFVSKGDIIGYTTPSPGKNRISLYYEVRFLSEGLDTLSFINWDKQNFKSIFDAEKNANLDLKSLMLVLNDIVKLNDMSANFAYTDVENLISEKQTPKQPQQAFNQKQISNNNLIPSSDSALQKR